MMAKPGFEEDSVARGYFRISDGAAGGNPIREGEI